MFNFLKSLCSEDMYLSLFWVAYNTTHNTRMRAQRIGFKKKYERNSTFRKQNYFLNSFVTSRQSIDHLPPWNGLSHHVTTTKLSPIVLGQIFIVESVDFNQAFFSAPDKIYLFRMIIHYVCTWTFQLDCLVKRVTLESVSRGKKYQSPMVHVQRKSQYNSTLLIIDRDDPWHTSKAVPLVSISRLLPSEEPDMITWKLRGRQNKTKQNHAQQSIQYTAWPLGRN